MKLSGERIKKLGLIINPVAGLGGRVGLKGSDGPDIQQQARLLGALPEAGMRTRLALEKLLPLKDRLEILTWPGEMGAAAATQAGFDLLVLGSIHPGQTTTADTQNAAHELCRRGVDLLLFAGGDGTARDISSSIGLALPVLGIPAGVKIHSGVFAFNPARAGNLAALFLQGKATRLRELEVMDINEEAARQGQVASTLFGYLKVPYERTLIQGGKAPSPQSEQAAMQAIAAGFIETCLEEDVNYFVGPGTTTRAIFERLGLSKTLIGVDVLRNRQLVAVDQNEAGLLEWAEQGACRIVVTPVGGQGFLFGRGNQPLSPRVIRKVGRKNIIVVSTIHKIHGLSGRPLRVDTGDPEVDLMLNGYTHILTGYREEIVYTVRV
jgi:predicted polyphosphate/ATP-dependent NAD kinase